VAEGAGFWGFAGVFGGGFGKTGVCVWCFCGEFVVDCVVNVDTKPQLFRCRKMGQRFEVYFSLLRSTEASY
jgi:hypothetical protein